MMDLPIISVIVPVHNSRCYLRQCLESIRNQTLTNIEIICVDDESEDNSVDIINSYIKKDNRFRLISQPNGGAGTARNNGLKHARGKYMSFLDADDFFRPDMLEKAYTAAEKVTADIVVYGCDIYENTAGRFSPCNYSIQYSLLPDKAVFTATEIKKDTFKAFMGWAWDKLFRADFIKQNNLLFQEQRTTNDLLFVFSALVKAEKITVIPDVLAHYRREEGSLSVTREKSWHCFYDALVALGDFLKESGLYETFLQDYINYCLHFSLWNLDTLAEPAHTLLYNSLCGEWFDNLGVTDHDRKYFYNKKEYLEFRWIMENPPEKQHSAEYVRTLKMLERKEKAEKIINSVKHKGVIYTLKLISNKLFSR